jgi:hypothetical protein
MKTSLTAGHLPSSFHCLSPLDFIQRPLQGSPHLALSECGEVIIGGGNILSKMVSIQSALLGEINS